MIAEHVNGDHLQRYIRERLDAGAATSTVNHEQRSSRRCSIMARRQTAESLPRTASPRSYESNPRSGFLTDEQYAAK